MSTKKDNFSRDFAVVAAVLAVICAILFLLNIMSGPRLRRVEFNIGEATREPAGRLIMHANQPLKEGKNFKVKLQPNAKFTATVSGESVLVQLNQRLNYSTDYTVTVDGLVASRGRKGGQFTYKFKTETPDMYFIKRNVNNEDPDQIIRTTLNSTKEEVMFTSDRIQAFVMYGQDLVVTTIDDNENNTNHLYLVNSKTKRYETLPMPAEGVVTGLQASVNQRHIGYSFSSLSKPQKYRDVLFNIDMAANRLLFPVDGLDKKPLQVYGWQFAPDGTTILAQTYDSSLLLIDLQNSNKPRPLGQYMSIFNFSKNGGELAVVDKQSKALILDLLTGSRTSVSSRFQRKSGNYNLTQDFHFLTNSYGLIEKFVVFNPEQQDYMQHLVSIKDGKEKEIFSAGQLVVRIGDYATSPNDQFITIETSILDDDGISDLYPQNPRQLNTVTQVIDANSGKEVRTLNGFGLLWY